MKRLLSRPQMVRKSGRPQEFDRDEVLERATELFWTKGYEATSIEDLVEATGINRGSIYHSFGSKKGLFLTALEHYSTTVAKTLIAGLSDPDPRHAMKHLFDLIVRRMDDPISPRGCLLTNTALECRIGAEDIIRSVGKNFGQIESAVYKVVRRAKANGLLRVPYDARAIARLCFCIIQGMNVISKTSSDSEEIRHVAKFALNLWYQALSTR